MSGSGAGRLVELELGQHGPVVGEAAHRRAEIVDHRASTMPAPTST